MEYKNGVENKVVDPSSRRFDLLPAMSYHIELSQHLDLSQPQVSQKTSCLFLLSVPDPT